MNVKINAKNMKYRLLFVVVYSIPFFSVEAQGVSSKGTLGYTFEEKKRDARASGDSFLQRGDTLYLLYDLTELQRECNKKFSFSAKKTLDIAQSLYEKRRPFT